MAKDSIPEESGDFGYDLEHSALYKAGGKNPNKPLTRHDMNEAQKEIDSSSRYKEYR